MSLIKRNQLMLLTTLLIVMTSIVVHLLHRFTDFAYAYTILRNGADGYVYSGVT